MKVYFDCSAITTEKISGIGLYAKNLGIALEQELHSDFLPVLKWSRWNKKEFVNKHLNMNVGPLAPICFGKNSVYHATDFKINSIFLGANVVTIHDMQPFLNKWMSPEFAENRRKVITCSIKNSQLKKIIATSEFTKKEIIHFFPEAESKIEVVYHGHNFEMRNSFTLENCKKLENIVDNRPFLFFIGNIEERKNLINQIKAFEIVKKKYSDLIFIIAGAPSFNFDEILKVINQSIYKNSIILPGYLSNEEKNWAFRNTACVMFASFYEGFGIPVIEALSEGAKLLTSNNSSLVEISDGYAYLANPFDVEEIAFKLSEALEKGNIKNINFESWKNRWSWKNCALNTLGVYERSLL